MLSAQYSTKRLSISLSRPALAPAAADYMRRNRDFLSPFEPVRPPEYTTLPFWQSQMEQDRSEERRVGKECM